MFCNKCGKEINDDAVVCIGCGCAVNESHYVTTEQFLDSLDKGLQSRMQ